ncbi:MAG: cupin domain-containing protein [Cytophaga sp.]|uniref:cupin domain-containing protein n=1 Tax=Cytophaga sp. TaxID=29535 RepID=UPI003F8040D8
MSTAAFYIEQLGLTVHPEGGYFKEVYRSEMRSAFEGFAGERNVSTSIYFLLDGSDKSHLHKIKSDETWFFHIGNSVEVVILHNGNCSVITLGSAIEKGEVFQFTVPAESWFGARIKGESGFGLVSCTVAPGFDFADFELAEYKKISREYPAYDSILKEMCL